MCLSLVVTKAGLPKKKSGGGGGNPLLDLQLLFDCHLCNVTQCARPTPPGTRERIKELRAAPPVTHTDIGNTSELPFTPDFRPNGTFAQRTPTHFRHSCA